VLGDGVDDGGWGVLGSFRSVVGVLAEDGFPTKAPDALLATLADLLADLAEELLHPSGPLLAG
jgi:hypothetical protein